MTHPAASAPRPATRRVAGLGARAATLLIVLVLLAGCGGGGRPASVVPPTPPTPSPSGSSAAGAAGPSATPTSATASRPAPPRDPRVVRWGRDGRLISIVVRNADRREVRSGKVRISLRDRTGRLLLSTTGPAGSKCCTLVSVPPGHRFGLFLPLADDVSGVAQVSVAFDDPGHVRLRRWTASSPRIRITDPRLTRTTTDAFVTADLEPRASGSPYVAGQAFLRGPGGRLVAVISGRFYCFADGQQRRVRMALQHPVPPGTRLGAVVAYPLPPHVQPHVAYSCPSERS